MKLLNLMVASAFALAAAPLAAQDPVAADTTAVDTAGTWVTLGTRGGPVASPVRAQPANLLTFDGKRFLIDVGDGAAGQLAKVGVPTAALNGIFLSHLHFDHTAGLAGILGLRFQTEAAGTLTIYGPPGTRDLVDGLLASMTPGATANYGVEGGPAKDHRAGIEVVELRDGAQVPVAGMQVTVRRNSHYSFAPGGEMARRFESLSLRFDLPGRSIVYTGDTGPSPAVEALARGADLLVAEMMDVEDTIAQVRRANPRMPEQQAAGMEAHLRRHHLLPRDVGELAARAEVKAVVVTHFVGIERGNPDHLNYLREIAEAYRGPVVIAEDLEAF